MCEKKKYRATFILGKRSDTLDTDGVITEERPVTVSKERVAEVINSFVGEIEQIPPMYSAVKKNGKKLYDLAREGVEIEREPRLVKIYSIDIVDISLPEAVIDVVCSKGTYIRSLCDDIGTRLGCGAVMSELRRTMTAGFTIDEAYTIEELDALENVYNVTISGIAESVEDDGQTVDSYSLSFSFKKVYEEDIKADTEEPGGESEDKDSIKASDKTSDAKSKGDTKWKN